MKISDSDITAVKSAISAADAHRGSGTALPKLPQTKEKTTVSALPTAEFTTPSSDRILINELEGANDEIRAVAQQIRAVDHTMEAIEQNLQKMTASLEGIVKSYPPYLQDSKERIAALRQFGGLRQLIDQLTMPPRDDSPAIILGDKNRFAEAGDWKSIFGKDQLPAIIRRQPVHSGTDGLDLPELAIDASDELVHKALGQMTHSYETLQRKRHGFAADANRAIATLL